jgi:hypothetical protein
MLTRLECEPNNSPVAMWDVFASVSSAVERNSQGQIFCSGATRRHSCPAVRGRRSNVATKKSKVLKLIQNTHTQNSKVQQTQKRSNIRLCSHRHMSRRACAPRPIISGCTPGCWTFFACAGPSDFECVCCVCAAKCWTFLPKCWTFFP